LTIRYSFALEKSFQVESRPNRADRLFFKKPNFFISDPFLWEQMEWNSGVLGIQALRFSTFIEKWITRILDDEHLHPLWGKQMLNFDLANIYVTLHHHQQGQGCISRFPSPEDPGVFSRSDGAVRSLRFRRPLIRVTPASGKASVPCRLRILFRPHLRHRERGHTERKTREVRRWI